MLELVYKTYCWKIRSCCCNIAHTRKKKQNKKTPPRSASLLKTVWSDILTVWNIFETNKISEKVIHFQLFILLSLVFLHLKQNKNRRIIFIFLHKCLSPMSMLKYAHLALSRNCLVYIFFINCKLELIKKKVAENVFISDMLDVLNVLPLKQTFTKGNITIPATLFFRRWTIG